VLVLEKAPQEMRGGNTHYSGGLLRIAFAEVADILRLVPEARTLEGFVEGVEPYPREAFWSDLRRMTADRTDPELATFSSRTPTTPPAGWPKTASASSRYLTRRSTRRQRHQMAEGRDRPRRQRGGRLVADGVRGGATMRRRNPLRLGRASPRAEQPRPRLRCHGPRRQRDS